jgi:sulfide:quinone oxidoreductase
MTDDEASAARDRVGMRNVSDTPPATAPVRVLIAGGGVAAVEAMVALKALAGDRVAVEMIAPHVALPYRPVTMQATSDWDGPDRSDLAALAVDVGARFSRDRLDAVVHREHQAQLTSGTCRAYDALILAVGTCRSNAIPGAITLRDHRAVERVVDGVRAGTLRNVVFAVPAGRTWALPLYEAALSTSQAAASAGMAVSVTIVTPERRPLELFGARAAHRVAVVLEEHGVRFMGDAVPATADASTGLRLRFDGSIPADRVVAVPRHVGRPPGGVPAGWDGFVATDGSGCVEGLDDVYAAGDMTDAPVTDGGLACLQADAVAAAIAARVGAPRPAPPRRAARETFSAGIDPRRVPQAEHAEFGHVIADVVTRTESGERPTHTTDLGRFLASYLGAPAPITDAAA